MRTLCYRLRFNATTQWWFKQRALLAGIVVCLCGIVCVWDAFCTYIRLMRLLDWIWMFVCWLSGMALDLCGGRLLDGGVCMREHIEQDDGELFRMRIYMCLVAYACVLVRVSGAPEKCQYIYIVGVCNAYGLRERQIHYSQFELAFCVLSRLDLY